jgi:hypothetical protein
VQPAVAIQRATPFELAHVHSVARR